MNQSFSEAPAHGVNQHARRRRHASVSCCASANRSA